MELTLEEKKGAYEAITEYLVRVTYLQARGHLAEDTKITINALRQLTRKLIAELNIQVNERNALSAGLIELVSEKTQQEVMSASEPTSSNARTILLHFTSMK